MHVVRRVLAHEYDKYRQHLVSLDADSRVLRFGYPVKDEIIDILCQGFAADPDHHVLFCVENHRLEFVAMGHIALGDSMELAFSVLKPYQGQGMGSGLIRRCIQWCRTHNVLEGEMVCLSHNRAIRHLCVKHGIHTSSSQGETQAQIRLDPAGVDTYMEQAIDQNTAIFDWLSKRALLPLVGGSAS